jgi:hypothetical protein
MIHIHLHYFKVYNQRTKLCVCVCVHVRVQVLNLIQSTLHYQVGSILTLYLGGHRVKL